MKLTRRQLGIAVTAAAAVAADAQNPAANNQSPDVEKSVREANARNSQTLAQFEIPIATEPAFQFKA